MRTFVALNLRPELRHALYAAAAPLRDALGPAVSWTAADALHVTLRFLGERSDTVVADLARRLGAAAATLSPVDLAIGGVGAFPSLAQPRVLWIGISANPALARLYHAVDDACASVGVPREQRAFHPHVTLGRVRSHARLHGAVLASAAATVVHRAVERVRSVDLMESVLGRGGARYRVAAAITLGSGSEEV